MNAESRADGPLSGTRVVAVEVAVAAPLCTRHLAELGADVIKIERVGKGDFARHYDAFVQGRSSHFVWLNHGKRSVELDLASLEGRAILAELLDTADVLVSNLGPGAIDRIVDPDVLRRRNRRLVQCVIDGYGSGGPFSQRKAYDAIIQGEAGVTMSTGTPGHPAKPGVSMADVGAGVYALAAILTALRERDRTGVGRRVEIALLDVVSEWMMPLLLAEMYSDGAPPPAGTHHASIVPYGAFRAADQRLVNIAVQNDEQWERLCRDVIDAPDLLDDPRLAGNRGRLEHRAEVMDALSERVVGIASGELERRLDAASIPWGRLNEVAEVVVHPQLHSRDRWRDVALGDDALTVSTLASPLSDFGSRVLPHIPELGEHTVALLEELALPPAQIDELVARGIIGNRAPSAVATASVNVPKSPRNKGTSMATVAPKTANWFTYFPEDYRWSSGVVNMLSQAPFGGSDIGEVDRVGRRLKARLGDDEAWFTEWGAEADKVAATARENDESGHRFSAASGYLRACSYYQMGERFRTPKDELALTAYRKSIDCFHRYAELTDRPRIERVEVPFEGASLPAYFVHAENTELEKTPCVVFFDGLDITKELQFMRGVPEMIRRGMSVLVMDGPGTGEAIRFRDMYLRPDYEIAGSAALDYLETREDVDSDRVGVIAVSLGGYYAPRCASLEPRFKACDAWGAIWDYHGTWKRRVEAAFNSSLSVPGHHITWILNVETMDEAPEPVKLGETRSLENY